MGFYRRYPGEPEEEISEDVCRERLEGNYVDIDIVIEQMKKGFVAQTPGANYYYKE